MTRPNPDRAAWLDRHTLAVDIAANWVGLTLLLAGGVLLLLHEAARQHITTTTPGFTPALAAVAAGRFLLEGARPWAIRHIRARRTQP